MPQHITPLSRSRSTVVATRVLTAQLAQARKQLALRGYTMAQTVRAVILAINADDGDAALAIAEDLLKMFDLPAGTPKEDVLAAVANVLADYEPTAESDAAAKILDPEQRKAFLARRKARSLAAKPAAVRLSAKQNEGYQPSRYQPSRAERDAADKIKDPEARARFLAARAMRAQKAAELEASRAATKKRRAAYEKNRAALTGR